MKKKSFKVRAIIAAILSMIMMTMPVMAAEAEHTPAPCFSNINAATVTIGFDMNNVVYCGLVVEPYSHGSGVSGLMKLFDSDGTCLEIWSVSDYERPIGVENTYQGVYGETYTVTFEGYAYSNNNTPADRIELSVTGTCVDAD